MNQVNSFYETTKKTEANSNSSTISPSLPIIFRAIQSSGLFIELIPKGVTNFNAPPRSGFKDQYTFDVLIEGVLLPTLSVF